MVWTYLEEAFLDTPLDGLSEIAQLREILHQSEHGMAASRKSFYKILSKHNLKENMSKGCAELVSTSFDCFLYAIP